MKNILIIIPARKGSKRLPGKNKKILCGKPLICWTIEFALKIPEITDIIVTSDDKDIEKICKKYPKIQFEKRPSYLAKGNIPMEFVIEQLLFTLQKKYDLIVLLQPTTPIRDLNHIEKCMQFSLVYNRRVISCDSNQHRIGNVYVYPASHFDTYYVESKNKYYVDIDYLEDFKKAEKLMKECLKIK